VANNRLSARFDILSEVSQEWKQRIYNAMAGRNRDGLIQGLEEPRGEDIGRPARKSCRSNQKL
jgi:hypothetical protein